MSTATPPQPPIEIAEQPSSANRISVRENSQKVNEILDNGVPSDAASSVLGMEMISSDPLEPRLLLTASLSGGVLTIVGTSAADQIEISHPALPRNSPSDQLVPNISRTLVRINQDDYEFSTSDIQ